MYRNLCNLIKLHNQCLIDFSYKLSSVLWCNCETIKLQIVIPTLLSSDRPDEKRTKKQIYLLLWWFYIQIFGGKKLLRKVTLWSLCTCVYTNKINDNKKEYIDWNQWNNNCSILVLFVVESEWCPSSTKNWTI